MSIVTTFASYVSHSSNSVSPGSSVRVDAVSPPPRSATMPLFDSVTRVTYVT